MCSRALLCILAALEIVMQLTIEDVDLYLIDQGQGYETIEERSI